MFKAQSRLLSVGVFVLFLILVFQIRERDIEFVLEPDFWSGMITQWCAFFATLKLSYLPVPIPHPYMDGQFIAYAIASGALHLGVLLFPGFGTHFPNIDSYNLAGAMLVNGVAFASAGYVFFRIVLSITASVATGFAMALLLIFSPSMIQISLLRCDYLAMLCVVILLGGALQIARGRDTSFVWGALGLALAFIANLKINGSFFALFLMCGLVARYLAQPRTSRIPLAHVKIFAVCFSTAMVFLTFRYWLHFDIIQFVENFWLSIERVREWTRIPAPNQFFYYHYELIFSHGGWTFITLYLMASAIVFANAVKTRDAISIFLSITFIAFSLAAIESYKYSRGGYHLLPIFLANIGYATHLAWRSTNPLGRPIALVGVVGILFSMSVHTIFFVNLAEAASERSIAIDQTRRAPRLWLKENVPSGSTICIPVDSSWAMPPLEDLPYTVKTGPFNFPYLDLNALKAFAPPTMEQAEAECSIILQNNFHQYAYGQAMHSVSETQAAKWDSFYRELARRHPPHVFSSAKPAFGVQRIEIFDMRTH